MHQRRQVEVGGNKGILSFEFKTMGGISEEDIGKLLHQKQFEQKRAGMGIRMSYVKRAWKSGQPGDLQSVGLRNDGLLEITKHGGWDFSGLKGDLLLTDLAMPVMSDMELMRIVGK